MCLQLLLGLHISVIINFFQLLHVYCCTSNHIHQQVVGDVNAVKSAIAIISSRLKESQHRDRSHLQGRYHSEDRYLEDDFMPRMNNASRRSSLDGAPYGSRVPSNSPNNRSSNYPSRSGGYTYDSEVTRAENSQPSFEDLVFRILCPNDRVESVVGESNGIMDLLQNEIGVDVKVSDHTDGSDERIIIISSDEVVLVQFIVALFNFNERHNSLGFDFLLLDCPEVSAFV